MLVSHCVIISVYPDLSRLPSEYWILITKFHQLVGNNTIYSSDCREREREREERERERERENAN